MKSDPIFFRYFQEMPRCFFRLIGRPDADAERYDLNAIEYKETAVRLDGVFQPHRPEIGPAYIWEAQNYASDAVYANLLSKVGRFLEHGNPEQDWVAVVIYPTQSIEQKNLRPYRCLLESDQLVRIYLDQLPPASPDDFEMGILELISSKPDAALAKAKGMVPRLRTSNRTDLFRRAMLQFIETVILAHFPKRSREEIEKMLQVFDLSETRVVREAFEEGREAGRDEGRDQTVEKIALEFLKLGRPVAEIAKATGLSPAKLRALKKKQAD